MTSRILVVDDNPDILTLLEIILTGEGYEVDSTSTAEKAERSARLAPPDLVIVDVGLPGMRGYELVRRLRMFTDVPVIFLTAATTEADQLEGFASGGSDYVLKPFLPHVLKARVRTHLGTGRSESRAVIDLGGVVVDLSSRSVTVNGIQIEMTRYEFGTMALLCENVGKIMNKSELMQAVWGDDWGDGHVVENTIYRLRTKLLNAGVTRPVITTHRGLGYRVNPVPRDG